jgi:hypothetical protein
MISQFGRSHYNMLCVLIWKQNNAEMIIYSKKGRLRMKLCSYNQIDRDDFISVLLSKVLFDNTCAAYQTSA